MADAPSDPRTAAPADGDPAEMVGAVYDKLRALAGRYMQEERGDHTLQPTALVHEAYLRLARGSDVDWQGKAHFFAVAARQMRRILVEHARAARSQKRGAGRRRVELHDAHALTPERGLDLLALEQAMKRLAERNPRQCRVAELRLFAGMLVEETARILRVSERTVKQDWRVARAWLSRELCATPERPA